MRLRSWGSLLALAFLACTARADEIVHDDQLHVFSFGVRIGDLSAAELLAPCVSGTEHYCHDCDQVTPCTGGSTGAWAQCIRGNWQCISATGGGGGTPGTTTPVTTLSSNTTLGAGHRGLVLCDVTAGNVTLTLPPVATSSGWQFTIKMIRTSGTAVCTISPASGERIESAAASASIVLGAIANYSYRFVSDGLRWRLATHSNLQTAINVMDYGATPDDSTDDTAAIQAAIDALPTGFVFGSGSSLRGGTVSIPTGQFRIGGTSGHCTSSAPANKVCTADADCTGGAAVGYCCALTSHGHALTMAGAGSFASEILMTGSDSLHGICINPGDNQSELRDLRIAHPATKVGTGIGVIGQGQRLRLRNLNIDRWGGDCVRLDGEQSVARTNSDRLDRVSAGLCGGDCFNIRSHNDASIHTITNSEAESCSGYGFNLRSSKNFISGIQVNGNTLGGLYNRGAGNFIAEYCETASQPFCYKVDPTDDAVPVAPDGSIYIDLSGSCDAANMCVDNGSLAGKPSINTIWSRGKMWWTALRPQALAPYTCDVSLAFNGRGGMYYDSDVHELCRCDAFATGAPFPVSMWCPVGTPVSDACLGGTSTDCGSSTSASGVGVTDVQLPNQDLPAATASLWQVGGHSRNQLYGINKLSNVTIASPTNGTCLGSGNPDPCCTGAGAGNCVALSPLAEPFFDSGTFSSATITVAATDEADLIVTTTSGSLPTKEFSSIASWFVSAQFRDPQGVFPRSIVVDAQYNGGGGVWNTIASTATANTLYRSVAVFSPVITSPFTITAIRWRFRDWSGTGTTRLLTVGLHHRSENPFPAYLSRDGNPRFGMLATLQWMANLGAAFNHITGPSDQPLKIVSGTGQQLLLNGREVCKDLVTNTTTVGNIGAGEDNLMTYTVPANTLSVDGNRFSFTAAGTIANNANAKRLRVKFGGTTILDTGATGLPNNAAYSWTVSGECIRTGATAQKCSATLVTSTATFVSQSGYSTAAETLSGAVIFALTGEATTTNDVVEETQRLSYCPGA